MTRSPSLDGRRFAVGSSVWTFTEDRLSGVVTAVGAGGPLAAGSLVGSRDGKSLAYRSVSLERSGLDSSASGTAHVEVLDDGRVLLHVDGVAWEELAGPRWMKSRVARPSRSLDSSVAFYSGLLGLAVTGSFQDHAGYDGVFLALPGGGELELTTGTPVSTAADDLLCLYLPSAAEVAALAAALPASVERVVAENPYWADFGVTVLDPDGYRVVLTSPPGA